MKRRGQKFVLLLIIVAGLYVAFYTVSFLCGEADYQKVLRGETPSFARRKWVLTDGGTIGYQGLGYTVLRIHSFREVEGQPPHSHYDSGASLRYELRWLFPFDRRSDRKQTEISGQ